METKKGEMLVSMSGSDEMLSTPHEVLLRTLSELALRGSPIDIDNNPELSEIVRTPKETIVEGKGKNDVGSPKPGFLRPENEDVLWLDGAPCDSVEQCDIFTSDSSVKSMLEATTICSNECPISVAAKCLKYALNTSQKYDVFALTPTERRLLCNPEKWRALSEEEKNELCLRAVLAKKAKK